LDVRKLSYFVISANNQLPGFACHHLIINHRMDATILGSHLMSRDSLLSSVQYYRLMVMSMILGIWSIGWTSFVLRCVILTGNYPLPNWKAIHSDDSTVYEFPTMALTPESISSLLALWWSTPGSAYLYFLLFGTSREVLSDYRKFWVWFRTRALRQMAPVNSSTCTICAGYVRYVKYFAIRSLNLLFCIY